MTQTCQRMGSRAQREGVFGAWGGVGQWSPPPCCHLVPAPVCSLCSSDGDSDLTSSKPLRTSHCNENEAKTRSHGLRDHELPGALLSTFRVFGFPLVHFASPPPLGLFCPRTSALRFPHTMGSFPSFKSQLKYAFLGRISQAPRLSSLLSVPTATLLFYS